MILNIRVIPKSARTLIKKENSYLKVYLTEPACDGQANKQLIQVLADHFCVRKYQVRIIKGEKSRHKAIEIDATV